MRVMFNPKNTVDKQMTEEQRSKMNEGHRSLS